MYFTYKQRYSLPDLSIFAMYKSYNANHGTNQVSIKIVLVNQIYGFFY